MDNDDAQQRDPSHMPAPSTSTMAAAASGGDQHGRAAAAAAACTQHDTHANQRKQQSRRGKKHKQQQTPRQQQPTGNSSSRPRKLKQPRTHEMPRKLAEILHEPKQALLHRVVRAIGPKAAWDLLKETLRVDAQGGQTVNALASGAPEKFLVPDAASQQPTPRKRTTGGIYFALLKDAVPRETYRDIYAVETKRKKDFQKRTRFERKQRFEGELAQLGFDGMGIDGTADGHADATATASGSDREDGQVDDAMDVA